MDAASAGPHVDWRRWGFSPDDGFSLKLDETFFSDGDVFIFFGRTPESAACADHICWCSPFLWLKVRGLD